MPPRILKVKGHVVRRDPAAMARKGPAVMVASVLVVMTVRVAKAVAPSVAADRRAVDLVVMTMSLALRR